jgi:tRNA threonylcarbamoyladenosine modification (KEOPS) complex  Pcc1 subunit
MPLLWLQDNLQDEAKGCEKSKATMRTTAQISFHFDSNQPAEDFFKVLNPETKSDSRVQSSLSLEDASVFLSIEAADRNAFRSAVNSYARWVRLYEDIGGIK